MDKVNYQDEVRSILQDPSVSFWLKGALESALRRDPLDAYYEAEALTRILKAKMDATLANSR